MPVAASAAEGQLYELLHILFDTYEDHASSGLSGTQREDFSARICKERLSAFVARILAEQDADTEKLAAAEHDDPLEAALRYLARGDVNRASTLLMQGRNYTLALLVAQLPNADDAFQKNIREQIDAWRDHNVLSEIDLNIRAIYELLSGNTTISEGKSGPVEHKAATFAISEHLQLGWLAMFAINLWYGALKNGTVEEVIEDFAHMISEGEESASPVVGDKEDPLWVALKLYAASQGRGTMPSLPAALSALGNPGYFDSLPSFRAYHAIVSALAGEIPLDVNEETADQVASDLASELEARADVPAAVWALLHLTDAHTRAVAIVQLLLRNAVRLPPPPADDTPADPAWATLTSVLKVPASWLYQALALVKRAEGDADTELRHLILADEKDGAHECLVQRVAPALVVDEDWTGLRAAVDLFRHVDGVPDGWARGGAVYDDFATLVTGGKVSGTEEEKREVLLARLTRSLGELQRQDDTTGGSVPLADLGVEGVRRRVALKEMGRVVANESGSSGGARAKDVLALPVTVDFKQELGRALAAEYYWKVMAGGH